MDIDRTSQDVWNQMLEEFEDCSIYQTWAYGSVRWGESKLSHLVLRRDGIVIGMAQSLIARLPFPSAGLAHIRWGPVCQRKGHLLDPVVVERMATALREEYVVRRKLLLRVHPMAYMQTTRGEIFERAFRAYQPESFRSGESYRTFVVDLRPSLDAIRRSFEQKWRNQLNRAERNELTIREDDDQGFSIFSELYRGMAARKGLPADSGVAEFAAIQRMLPERQRMKVLVCERQGNPIASIVGGGFGSTGIYLLGATSDEGMKSKGAYLLQWRMIEWLKVCGIQWYDLGGINPETNFGVYHFKKGLSGLDLLYLNPRVLCDSALSGFLARIAQLAKNRRRGRNQPPVPTGSRAE